MVPKLNSNSAVLKAFPSERIKRKKIIGKQDLEVVSEESLKFDFDD